MLTTAPHRKGAAATHPQPSLRCVRRATGPRPAPRERRPGPEGYRSISPNTTSSVPMIAETSASMCPRFIQSIACRCA